MKIRSGFVSNSSSSSYIIRGIAITEEEATRIAEEAGKDIEDLAEAIYDVFPFGEAIQAQEKRNYFDCDEETGYIVGKDLGDLEDGSFVEIPEPTVEEDTKILKELAKYGITGKLKTYVKMISNDNY